jgi:valyl-tRNA synthetase
VEHEGRYDFREAEPRLQERWSTLKIFEFDPTTDRQVYAIDTPPPTVSGEIHIGHVFSYTHADIAARYQRMRGKHVFYPFGFDDNGLPTERFTEQVKGITAREVGRDVFIRACLELSSSVEERFERFWKRLGLSVDWRLKYSTIDDRSRRVAQRGFLDLLDKGLVTRREAPALWCPHCETAVAQADVQDKADVPASFVTLAFKTKDGRSIRIATTRPEMLPACVAVFVHPDDARYAGFVGSTVVVPVFGLEVPILADRDAQPDKGTGAVMCCTFGDATDVGWWYRHRLPLRIAITPDGRMNELAGSYQALRIKQARARTLEDLSAAGLILERQEIAHSVGVHERCGTPIEFLILAQWFISLLDHKEQFLEAGRQIRWYPDYMYSRYASWVAGLAWDWNISRQRVYGVPFPVWYCDACGSIMQAHRDLLPVDPATSRPQTPCETCGGGDFTPETDVMDTWATSSLSPRICATLAADFGLDEDEFLARLYPMSLRPNAHDIIRTWDFYSIVQSLFHTGVVPWQAVLISGHAQDESGKKLSKSKLKAAADPTVTIEQFSADAVRYWTAGVRTGSDTILSEEAFRQGSRLVTKLWNAARFITMHGAPGAENNDVDVLAMPPTDRWILGRLGHAVARATVALDEHEPAAARAIIERFFWSDFCDTYLELVKFRLMQEAGAGERASALRTLRSALLAVIKMLAPFLPHITEEIYLREFAGEDGAPSVHVSAWPDPAQFPCDELVEQSGDTMLAVVEYVRRWKAERNMSVGAAVREVRVTCPTDQAPVLCAMEQDLRSITRAERVTVSAGDQTLEFVEGMLPVQ